MLIIFPKPHNQCTWDSIWTMYVSGHGTRMHKIENVGGYFYKKIMCLPRAKSKRNLLSHEGCRRKAPSWASGTLWVGRSRADEKETAVNPGRSTRTSGIYKGWRQGCIKLLLFGLQSEIGMKSEGWEPGSTFLCMAASPSVQSLNQLSRRGPPAT